MKIRRHTGINIETVLKLIILLGFAAFFYKIIKTGNVQYYVHSRIVPYMKFGIFSFLLISIFFVTELFKIRRKNTRYLYYIVFIIPLITAFTLSPETMSSTSMLLNNINTNNSSDIEDDNINLTEDTIVDNEENNLTDRDKIIDEDANNLTFEGNTIAINDDNFLSWNNELYMNIDDYIDNNIEMKGFVLKDNRFKQNEFVSARLLMVCCAADMQPVGILCRYDKASELETDSWIKVYGTLKSDMVDGEKVPVIEVKNIEKIEKPENEFLYPY